MSRLPTALLASLLLGSCLVPIRAQEATYTITPDSGPPGTTRTIAVTAPPQSGIDYLAIFCLLQQAWSGGPNGTPVPLFGPVCAVIPVPLPPCGTASTTWTPPANLSPGTWWLQLSYLEPGTFNTVNKWVDFRIDAPPEPTLTAGPPVTGQTWSILLSDPSAAGAGYVAAASLTTDTGLAIGLAQPISLDPDAFFLTSFPNPSPLLFMNFQGTLDGAGQASLGVHVPNVPGIACIGLHVQTLLILPAGGVALSNCLDAVIQ